MSRRFGFRLLIWPTHHPAARCNIRPAVLHAARAVVGRRFATPNGRSCIVLSRVGEGEVLAIEGLARGGGGNLGRKGAVGPESTGGIHPDLITIGDLSTRVGYRPGPLVRRYSMYSSYNHWLNAVTSG